MYKFNEWMIERDPEYMESFYVLAEQDFAEYPIIPTLSSLEEKYIMTYMEILLPQQVSIIDKMFPVGTIVKTIKNGKVVDHKIDYQATNEEKEAMQNWMSRKMFGPSYINMIPLPYMTDPQSVSRISTSSYGRELLKKEGEMSKKLMEKYGLYAHPSSETYRFEGKVFKLVYRPKTDAEKIKFLEKEKQDVEQNVEKATQSILNKQSLEKSGGMK